MAHEQITVFVTSEDDGGYTASCEWAGRRWTQDATTEAAALAGLREQLLAQMPGKGIAMTQQWGVTTDMGEDADAISYGETWDKVRDGE